jgi:integral membrane protein
VTTNPSPTLTWFFHVARAEGLSLLLLFGVAMPLKYALGNPILVPYVGWAHGVLVFLYLIALQSVARVEGWGLTRIAAAFVASLLPFGTFVFERRLCAAPQ